jgi:putative membrane protein
VTEEPERSSGLADGEWHRVHPLTPVVRSWQLIAVVLVLIAQTWGDDLVTGGLPPLRPREWNGRWLAGGGALLLLGFLAVIGLAFLSWRMTRFRVSAEALELHTGVLFRQQRSARLDRVQAVDVVQPLVARLAGVARITLEVAGGSGSGVTLSYLTEAQARSLRNHLLARAAGIRYASHEEAPEAPEHETLDVPIARLIASLALSGPTFVLIVGGIAFVVAGAVSGRFEAAFGVLPMLLGVGGVLWARFSVGFGFRIATSPDGLRLRHGLLEQRAQTVPPGRVQAVRVSQPLLWRAADWWTVRVNVAGYGGAIDAAGPSGNVLLPVGGSDDVMAVLALVLPDLGVDDGETPFAVVGAGMTGSGESLGFGPAPRRARWLDPVGWSRIGVRVTRSSLLIRRGRWWRQLDLVPHARSQSWGLAQGPMQRRLGLASFTLHSTPGPVDPKVPHLDRDFAQQLLAGQAVRARAARAAAGPERWMERPGHTLRGSGAPVDDLEQPTKSAEPSGIQQFVVPDPERG